ncbi:MAG: hypothetical protein U0992_17700 [Planctomycetaceae bacterium]
MLELHARSDLADHPPGAAVVPLDGIETTLWTAGAPPIRGSVLEMSPRDLKLQLYGDVKAGHIVDLEVFSRVYGFHFSVRGQLHWRQAGTASTIAGVFLHRALPHDVVGPFWSDLRKELRYNCDWTCLILPRRRRRSFSAQLLNYSRSGFLMACRDALSNGEDLAVLDPSHANGAAIVSGIVRWQSQHTPSETLVGCEVPEDHGLRISAYLRTAGCW